MEGRGHRLPVLYGVTVTTTNTKEVPMPAATKGPKSTDLAPYQNDPILYAIATGVPVHLSEAADPDEVRNRINQQIMAAESALDILNAGSATELEGLLDIDLLVTGVEWRDSDYADGPGVYALMQVIPHTGERLTVQCGAEDVIFRIRKIELVGGFADGAAPVWIKLSRAKKPTAAGFYPINIGPGKSPSDF